MLFVDIVVDIVVYCCLFDSYSEVTDGYNVPFNFNEAEVSPLDLLTRQNQQRDIVEMMFQV